MQTKAEIKGLSGEIEIINFLQKCGWEIRRLDLLGYAPNGKWYMIEVKNKEPWEPPPTYQQGLPNIQFTAYKGIQYIYDFPSILIVRDQNDSWLAEFVENLKPNNYRKLRGEPKPTVFFNLDQFTELEKFLHRNKLIVRCGCGCTP